MTARDKKIMQKQEKERQKREKEEAKRRKKEEEQEKKRLQKEKKALLAQEKKAAKQKSKQKGAFVSREPEVRERRDSKNSNDIGRDWEEARAHEDRGNITPERTRKRLSSFEDIKNEVDRDSNKDRPPTPPEPLPVKKGGGDSRSVSGSSDFNSADEADERGHVVHDEHDREEVSI